MATGSGKREPQRNSRASSASYPPDPLVVTSYSSIVVRPTKTWTVTCGALRTASRRFSVEPNLLSDF